MDKAETYFKKALSIEPKLVEAMVSMADVLTTRKKYREAESYIRKAVAINPKSFDYNWTLGDILCRAGRYEESYEIYKKICAEPEAKKVKGEMDAWHEELLEHLQSDPKPKAKIKKSSRRHQHHGIDVTYLLLRATLVFQHSP